MRPKPNTRAARAARQKPTLLQRATRYAFDKGYRGKTWGVALSAFRAGGMSESYYARAVIRRMRAIDFKVVAQRERERQDAMQLRQQLADVQYAHKKLLAQYIADVGRLPKYILGSP